MQVKRKTFFPGCGRFNPQIYLFCRVVKVISITIIKMTDVKLCTMNLNHLMNNINIYVNSECIECRSYAECYTEFIQRHANYKKNNK